MTESIPITNLNRQAIQACFTNLTYDETKEALRLLTESLNPGEPVHDALGIPLRVDPMDAQTRSRTSRQIVKDALYKYHMLNDDTLTLEKMINRTEYKYILPHYIVSCMIDYPDDEPLLGLSYLRQMMFRSLFSWLDAGYVKAAHDVILETEAVKGFHNRTKIMYKRFCQMHACKKSKAHKYNGGEKIDTDKLLEIPDFEDLEPDADGYKISCHVENYLGMDILNDDDD